MEEISVGERVEDIERFMAGKIDTSKKLSDQTPTPLVPPPPQTYADESLRLLSIIATNQGSAIQNQNRIIKNQELERKSWERNNPLTTDSPVYDWAEATINPGYQVIFTLAVPEGSVFFFEYFNITYNVDSTYDLSIDSAGTSVFPTLTDVLQDFGDHLPIFKPPRLCYMSVVITALNNGVLAQTYSCFVRGFFRQSIKTEKEYLGQQ